MKSMTGYGRATARTERYEITAEVHSVNHRYLETSVRLPRSFSYLEGKIKEQVQQAVSRGKVEVALTMQSIGSKDTTVEINHDVVMAYLRAVAAENELLRESGLPKNQIVLGTAGSESGGATDALPLSTLLRIPDAFQVQQVAEDADVIWSEVQPVVTEALQQFAEKRLLPSRQQDNIRRAFEEICATNIIPRCGEKFEISVAAEYSEESGKLRMRFVWPGERFDPLEEGEELSVKLLRAYCPKYEFSYENGKNDLNVYL